jgi:hypothetical protein
LLDLRGVKVEGRGKLVDLRGAKVEGFLKSYGSLHP